MSLVGSIFGGASEEKPAGLTSLFDESSTLPEKPQHKPLPPRKKKRKETPVEGDEQEPGGKKKRKPRKAAKESDDTAAETDKTTTQEESKDNVEERTVFVGNLPIDTTRKSLASMFKSCGKVESCRLRSVAAAGVKLPTERAGDQVRRKQ